MVSVSVVIPSYNRAALIGEAIASVQAQTRAPHEIIVVDDASTDDSANVAERAGARVIRLAENRGNSAARNAGTRAASGDVVAWLDSDDYWEPQHLATVAGLLDAHEDAAVANAAVRLVGTRAGTWYGRVSAGPPAFVLREAFYATVTQLSSTVVRREALIAAGGFDETERCSVDFDLLLRLARSHRFVSSREVTANYRWHGAQISTGSEAQVRATYRFRRRLLDELRRDGENDLAEELAEIFRERLAEDLWGAWNQGQTRWLRQLLALASLVPAAPRSLVWKWALRSRIPVRMVPFLRAVGSGGVVDFFRRRAP